MSTSIEEPFEEEEEEAELEPIPEISYPRADRIDSDMSVLRSKGILPDDIINVLPKYYRIADDPEKYSPRELSNPEIKEVRDMVDDIIRNLDSILDKRSLFVESPEAKTEVANIQKYIPKIMSYEFIEADYRKDADNENADKNIFSTPKVLMSHKSSKKVLATPSAGNDDDQALDTEEIDDLETSGTDDDNNDDNNNDNNNDNNDEDSQIPYDYVRTPARKHLKHGIKFNPDIQDSAFKPKSKFTKTNEYNYVMKEVEPSSVTLGRRNGKNYENVKGRLGEFGNLSLAGDSTAFKKNFLDMIINGNFRVKYIPLAAARDTAKEYCLNHLDENGVPNYRLLPPNSYDPLGNEITDLNGDQVDDIILVDKRGIPAIVNGYKLVHASPYKKVWKTICNSKAKRKATPFNVWLKQQFDKNINKVDWNTGEYQLTKSNQLLALEKAYGGSGLGKAHISKRLSPNSYWASLFSHIWNTFWDQKKFYNWLELKKLTNFLAVCNTIYIYYFDLPMKNAIEKNKFDSKSLSYPAWSNWKRTHKQDYMKAVGPNIDKWVKIIAKIVNLQTGVRNKNQPPREMLGMLALVEEVVFKWGFGMDFKTGLVKQTDEQGHQTPPFYAQLITFIQEEEPEELNRARKSFIENIDNLIELRLYGENSGYTAMKSKNKAARDSKKNDADRFNVVFNKQK